MQHHGNLLGDSESVGYQESVSLLAKVVCVAERFAIAIMNSKLPLSEGDRSKLLLNLEERFKVRSYSKLLTGLKNIAL